MNVPVVTGKNLLKVADFTTSPVVVSPDTEINVFTNRGAAGAVTFTLPPAVVGMQFTFIGAAAQNIVITPATGGILCLAGTPKSANASLTGTGALTLVCQLTCLVAGTWADTIQRGTWA